MYDVVCFLPFPDDFDFDFFLFLLLTPCRLEGSFEVVLRVEAFLLRPTFFGLESAMMAFLAPAASAFWVRLRRGMPDLALAVADWGSSSM